MNIKFSILNKKGFIMFFSFSINVLNSFLDINLDGIKMMNYDCDNNEFKSFEVRLPKIENDIKNLLNNKKENILFPHLFFHQKGPSLIETYIK